jgi:hypothetical protein
MAHPHRKIVPHRPSTITPSQASPFAGIRLKPTHKLRKVADLPPIAVQKVYTYEDDDFDLLATVEHNIG